MQKITTTIRRDPLRAILARTKKIEYRDIKPFWEHRFAQVERPFLMRLRNGMIPDAPEVTVRIDRVLRDSRRGVFKLHIGKIVSKAGRLELLRED